MSSRDHLPSHIKFRLKSNLEKVCRPWYRLTAPWRALPNFIIIGAARAGSTHFFYTLQQHPQVLTSRIKEVSFFSKDKRYQHGENGYRSYFPLQSRIDDNILLGEATPKYLFDARTPERIAHMLREVKLIALLRNPTERTISNFFYNKTKTRSKCPDNRTIEEFVLDNNNLAEEPLVQRGMYFEQLQRYEYFRERGQLLVLRSEDMFDNRAATLAEACRFLGIDDSFKFSERKAKNAAINKTEVPSAVRERLDALFKPHNEALAQYLETDVWW